MSVSFNTIVSAVKSMKEENKGFSFSQMVNSGFNGETSATGFCGVIACLVSILFFVVLVVFYLMKPAEAGNIMELCDKFIILFGMGCALLGVRKITGVIGSKGKANVIDGIETCEDNAAKASK